MENETASVAYCIPTYNHAAVMRDVLGEVADLYKKYQIDVYIYDSCEENDTKEIVAEFLENGYDNIHYIRLISTISPDEKAILILSGYGLIKEYDYIWLVKDRAYFEEDTLKAVLEATKYGYDAVFLGVKSYPDVLGSVLSDALYEDPSIFFRDWGWLATSMDVTIMNYNSLLKDVDWQDFKDRYFVNGRNSFDHFMALFIGLAKRKKPVIKVLGGENINRCNSLKGDSCWFRETFFIWGYLWPKAVRSLPDCYNAYKEKVIKQETMLPELFGSYGNLIRLKQTKGLTHEIFSNWRKQWKEFTDIPEEDVDLILDGKCNEIAKRLINEIYQLITSGDFNKLFFLYWNNLWLSTFMEKRTFSILGNCLLIYRTELERKGNTGVFREVAKLEDIIEKYQGIKYFLRRVEYGIAAESQHEFLACALRWGVTTDFLSFAIMRECINAEKTVNRIEHLCSGSFGEV